MIVMFIDKYTAEQRKVLIRMSLEEKPLLEDQIFKATNVKPKVLEPLLQELLSKGYVEKKYEINGDHTSGFIGYSITNMGLEMFGYETKRTLSESFDMIAKNLD